MKQHHQLIRNSPFYFLITISLLFLVNLSHNHNYLLRPTDRSNVSIEASSRGKNTSSTTFQFVLNNDTPRSTPSQVRRNYTGKASSHQSTVMGFAIGYDISVYHRFVGSLRRSGFQGQIILAVSPDLDKEIRDYLVSRNVMTKEVQFVNCSTELLKETEVSNVHDKEVRTCVFPYHYLKARWGRYPLLRDYLEECKQCAGPVLISDVRDTFFQCDPFGDNAPHKVAGLQVFEEDKRMKTTNWLVKWPVKECKGVIFDKPMLCSGTTIGTRKAMLEYLDTMHTEMKSWMQDPKCHFKINGDDQSIHNYLYYNGNLTFASAIPNRMGIVNTVGAQSAIVKKDHEANMKDRGITGGREAQMFPYPGANMSQGLWVGTKFQLTDDRGYFTNLDGHRSCVIHQYDRYGFQLERWLQKYSGLLDT